MINSVQKLFDYTTPKLPETIFENLSGYGRNTINGVAFLSNDGKSTSGFNYSFGLLNLCPVGQIGFDMRRARKHKILPPYDHNQPTEYYHLVKDVFDKIKSMNIEIFRARLSRIQPHSSIPDHSDSASESDYCVKIHIPIITNDKAVFKFADGDYYLKAGSVYIANVANRHSFENNSDYDRYHIIADCIVKNESLPFFNSHYEKTLEFYRSWRENVAGIKKDSHIFQ